MKYIVVFLVGAAAFIGVFIGVNALISLIASGIQNPDLKGIAKVVLWIFGFGITLFIAIVVGAMSGGLVDVTFNHIKEKRKYAKIKKTKTK